MLKWWRLARAEHSIIVLVAIMVAEAIASKRVDASLILPALGPAILTAGVFSLGDWFGWKTDKANKRKDRPIVAGEIRRKDALLFAGVLYLLGLLLSFAFAPQAFWFVLAYALLSVTYDPILKKIPLVGNLFVASTMAASFIYGGLVVAAAPIANAVPMQPPEYSFIPGGLAFSFEAIPASLWILAAMAFCAGVGRELLITLRDVKGDKKIGAKTLPMILGAKRTVMLASAFIYAAIAISALPIIYGVGLAYLALVTFADLLFMFAIFKAVLFPTPETLREVRNLTLWAMMAGTLAFATLAFS
ncbi:Digeranylgeranylglyceryl phosphate synthase [Candidatus Norongarragalina meridionalis]|nr:Digeranylgeranylglyceryl phosphate synthase [Candidatus Norongarragalina meridionalis]